MANPPTRPTVPGPVDALREVAFWLERERAETRRVQAYRKAADALAALDADDFAVLAEAGTWQSLPGIGPSTGAVIVAAAAGRVPTTLAKLRTRNAEPLAVSGLLASVRGDLHTHTTWSDGGSPLDEMVRTAELLGHEYLAITDHSPRTRIANGLTEERRELQLQAIAALQPEVGIRVLSGIEVDILDDGALDQNSEMLARLDVVVASVHSKLAMDASAMTRRMVQAVANPHVNVLGHCTGRLVAGDRGLRAPSQFDAEVVFEACRHFGVAVEINSRPERCDPPDDLLALARDIGCVFSIDTDAHAPGQLEFLAYGAQRAEAAGLAADRIVSCWPVDELLGFCAS